MNTVKLKEDIVQNLWTLENYLCEGNEEERQFAIDLIRKGSCFIVYKVNDEIRFSPSRFSGYISNDRKKHLADSNKDGRETNPIITKILQTKLLPDESLEQEHLKYCIKLGATPDNRKKKFWDIGSSASMRIKDKTQESSFPEGAIVERIHLSRERDKRVIDLAKDSFRKSHGRLFCQICGFDFEEKYGERGKDYIEGHHTIAVSEMLPGHQTKPEEIAMVCANCHRMLHRSRPWLPMQELSNLLK